MLDWTHIGEVMIGNVFVAGVTYGVIKTKIAEILRRLDAADEAREIMSNRIDSIFLKLR